MEISEKLRNDISPILEQQDKLQQIVNAKTIPKFSASLPALEALKDAINNNVSRGLQENFAAMNTLPESTSAMQMFTGIGTAFDSTVRALGEIAMKSAILTYQFECSTLKGIEALSNGSIKSLAAGLEAFVTSPVIQEIQSISSIFGKWLQTVDFSPLTSILESIQNIGFDYDYEKVNEVYLKAMFDARWFPYAGWIADSRMFYTMLEIMNTSRASKNRVKKIDKLIFSYYGSEEINKLKRGWKQMNLPSCMTRILVQSVQAYHRREYALTVSALSTLWEGIIQNKTNDVSYRISRKTRENLSKLIEENEFDKIFSSFCEEFIFYNCTKPEDVKPDVPGRHSIAHCWYNTYPSRKMALNAILFTDFLFGLKPLEKPKNELNSNIQNL